MILALVLTLLLNPWAHQWLSEPAVLPQCSPDMIEYQKARVRQGRLFHGVVRASSPCGLARGIDMAINGEWRNMREFRVSEEGIFRDIPNQVAWTVERGTDREHIPVVLPGDVVTFRVYGIGGEWRDSPVLVCVESFDEFGNPEIRCE